MNRRQVVLGAFLGVVPCVTFGGTPDSGRQTMIAVAPEYPDIARQAQVAGEVTVRVRVDKRGKVVEASVVDGTKLLGASALAAARLWEFGQGEAESSLREIVFSDSLLPENACWQKSLSRFVPPARVEIARRKVVPTCLDCGPEKPIVYETCE